MKKLFVISLSLLLLATLAARAAEEITIKGKGLCAKCSLKETDECQTAIQVEKDGKKTTYYLVANKEAKAFHKNVCKAPVDVVKAVGTVEEKDGKKYLTVSKIEKIEETK